ncbi:MAG: trypsin-like peptidase domain-containing protein [Deferrisomatales bacterium]
MKICPTCSQTVGETVARCPACGGDVGAGRQRVDDYRIVAFVHEGYGSLLYQAVRDGDPEPVLLRLFKPESGITDAIAERLRAELRLLAELPDERFVRHREVKRSSDGVWYRVSEWVDAERWGDLVASGYFEDHGAAFVFFARVAEALEELHEADHFIPHLILDDLLASRGADGALAVQVDYKLSRFVDPKLERPSPALRHLLECHPDFMGKRPLDPRSDMWALGKVFVELLSGKTDLADHRGALGELSLPEKIETLLRRMLDDDPDRRPGSMARVAGVLRSCTAAEIHAAGSLRQDAAAAAASEGRRTRTLVYAAAAAVVALLLGGVGLQWRYGLFSQDDTRVLTRHVERTQAAVVYVVTEYWLTVGGEKVYAAGAEGTAFLADGEGHLVTNRHVACPWLGDEDLGEAIQAIKERGAEPGFGHRTLVWFDGARAFYRHGEGGPGMTLADRYRLETAYRSDGTPSVAIAGVAPRPATKGQALASPLGDDVAILRLEPPPRGVAPIPLAAASPLKPLSAVVALGFAKGRDQMPSELVVVSATKGNVRRVFPNLIQVDVSLHHGNSGGPILDAEGRACGVASAIAGDGFFQEHTDFGQVLPIAKAAELLARVKGGVPTWDGAFDPALPEKLEHSFRVARQGRWDEAVALADAAGQGNTEAAPRVLGAVVRLGAGDVEGARQSLAAALGADPANGFVRFLAAAFEGAGGSRDEALRALDWTSPQEFYGFLARVLDGAVDEAAALAGWETRAEQALLAYTVALRQARQGRWEEAEARLRDGLLVVDDGAWEILLLETELERVQGARARALAGGEPAKAYERDRAAFRRACRKAAARKEAWKQRWQELTAALGEAEDGGDKIRVLEMFRGHDPDNRTIPLSLAFEHARAGRWDEALTHTAALRARPWRENGNWLGLNLFHAQLLYAAGRRDEARAALQSYRGRIADPWYAAVAACLLGEGRPEALAASAGERPEKLIALRLALGFQAEADGDRGAAIRHYLDALETHVDGYLEYQFARSRIGALRGEGG